MLPEITSRNRFLENPFHWLWNALTAPPYPALPWAVFVYALLSCLIYTDNGPFTGHIIGFDDQVRMTQVLQWVNGAGWYDRMITRVDAPEGFQTIWARIVDIPIAAIIVMAQFFVDQRTAALVAGVVLPLAELALMFRAARYLARPIAGKAEARLVILFVMFTTVLNHKLYTLAGFHLGEASHHAWYGILDVVMFGAAVRIVLGVAGWKPKLMMAAAMALLLAVGVEPFPLIAGVAAIFAVLAWGFRNPHLAWRGGVAFGIGALMSLLLLPMHMAPEQFFDVSLIQPSIIGPTMLAAAAIFLLLQNFIVMRIRNHAFSAVMLIVAAGLIAEILLALFPEIRSGTMAGLSPNERILAANEHPEIWAMWKVASDWIDYVGYAVPLVIALAAALLAIIRNGNKRRRMLFGAYAGLAAVSGGLAQVYWRYFHHALSAACPLLLFVWQYVRWRLPLNAGYRFLSFATFVMLAPFWMLLLPAFDANVPILSQVVFFPGKIYSEPNNCDVLAIADFLNRHYDTSTDINVPDWQTADFLYETNLHIDFLSNYPSHDHFIDNKVFFQTQDMDQAARIAAQHHFNLVTVCRDIPMLADYAATRPNRQPNMIERLKEGIPPSWLKPVYTGVPTNYLLYEIDPAALAAATKGH